MGDCNCKNGNTGPTGTCVECDITQMARNNYFTGKLLVERDFTDEQRYLIGKLRRHNQRLHGWGAVCGLKVKPHPNPACQDRFVVIEPGTAIDCCGREILVTHEEYFDFKFQFLTNWQKQYGPNAEPDDQPHKIQICVAYRECATEEVPALFDDCSCDMASCQPNRILESYAFDLLIDPPQSPAPSPGVELDWACTINLANAVRVAKNDETKRLYVLTSDATAKTAGLYQIDAANNSILASQTFPQSAGLDVAVSPEGDFVYLALQPSAGGAPQVQVLATADITQSPVSKPKIGTKSDPDVQLAVFPAPDRRLIAVSPKNGVFIWGTDITTTAAPQAAKPPQPAISNPVAVAMSDNGQFAYVTSTGPNQVSAVAASNLAATPITTTALSGVAPSAVAVAATTSGDLLAVADVAAAPPAIYFVNVPTPATAADIGAVKNLTYKPVELRLSAGGRWAYVLEEDSTTGKVYLQTIDEHALALNLANIVGSPIAVGIEPMPPAGLTSMTLSQDGSQLFVPYSGDGKTTPGAVAVINVLQANCPDIFKQAIEGCPDCPDGNCIVLATIQGYIYGNPITETEIDNLTDRHLLVSTDLLTEVVRCLLDQGIGGGKTGPQGPPGSPGKDGDPGAPGNDGGQGPAGPGITDVDVNFVPCDQPGSASLSGVAPNLTLNLTIPGPCNPSLVGIETINWDHGGTLSIFDLESIGLAIAFTDNVRIVDISANSVAVLVPVIPKGTGLRTWTEAVVDPQFGITLQPGIFTPTGDANVSAFVPGDNGTGFVNGLTISFSQRLLAFLRNQPTSQLRVCVRGDFIRDAKDQAIDADHLPPWLPMHPLAGRRTGDGIEGGTFESWFNLMVG